MLASISSQRPRRRAACPARTSDAAKALDVAATVGRLNLLLDHEDARVALDRAARGRNARVPVFLKVDCGYHRAGVDPQADASVALARRIAGSSGLELAGVLTHGGHGYDCRDRDAIAVVAAEERDVTEEEPRVGVFACHCGANIGQAVQPAGGFLQQCLFRGEW